MSVTGHFVWYELLTWEKEKSTQFFENVIGWKSIAYEGGSIPYSMFSKDGTQEKSVGGILEMVEPKFNKQIPNHFMGYIGTDDINASAAKAEILGANIHHGPNEIPEVGLFAVVEDPQGIYFCLFQPQEPYEPSADLGHGDFSWNELATTDYKASFDFYSKLFGWEIYEDMDMGGGNIYRLFGPKGLGRSIGGMFNKPEEMPHSGWLFYVTVDDINATIENLKDNGGQVLNGPMKVPGGDLVAQCMGNDGTPFALHMTNGNTE